MFDIRRPHKLCYGAMPSSAAMRFRRFSLVVGGRRPFQRSVTTETAISPEGTRAAIGRARRRRLMGDHLEECSAISDEKKMARLLSINVGLPHDIPWQGKTVHTGVWKT